MDDKKTHNIFLPDAESEPNFWMIAQQRAHAPGIPGYPGFYPMLRPMTGAPGISPIRHILPQIPTRASNPRTAISKASLREPFPGLPRSDVMFSNFVPGDPLSREIIWREDCKGSGREVLDQEDLAKVNKMDYMASGNEFVQDMSMSAVRTLPPSKVEGDDFPVESDFRHDVWRKRELMQKADDIIETNQPIDVDNVEKEGITGSVNRKIMGNDDQNDFGDSENDASDGSSIRVSSAKSKEAAAPTNPIKLKIRCDFKEGHKELMAIMGNDSENKDDRSPETTADGSSATSVHPVQVQQSSPHRPGGLLTLAPSSPQTVLHSAPVPSPSMNVVRPKTGRAKTNAELKKQLMEKRAVQYLKGQGDGGSQASSPATSHLDVSSPASQQADVPSPLSTHTEGVSADVLDSLFEKSTLNRNSQNGKGKRSGSGTLAVGVSEPESPSFDPPHVETKWVVGDMLWTRVSGHPWWPCIVSPDPFQQTYTKVITRGKKIFRQYHVQFFGDEGERGWVQESTAIPFEGRTKFENFCEEMIKEHKKDKKNYTVTPNRRRAWEVAVTNAEHARTMPRVRRVEEYVTMYNSMEPVMAHQKVLQTVDKDSTSSTAKSSEEGATRNKSSTHAKQQRKSSLDLTGTSTQETDPGSPPRKKKRLAEPEVESPSHIKLPKNISNQHVVQYTVFCQKRRESVKNEHPEYDDERIENCLQQQWSKLDDETRSRFIPMGSDFTYLSQMMATKVPSGVKRSSRFVKPKKRPTFERQEKEKFREVVADDDSKEKEVLKEGTRTSRQRMSAEKKFVDLPASKQSCGFFIDKVPKKLTSEIETSSPVASPLSRGSCSGIPPKKRGRKSKETNSPSEEKLEQEPSKEDLSKLAVPTIRKEPASKSIACKEDEEDTEEELDEVNVCFFCEKSTKGIEKCQGSCRGHFHPSCLGQSSPVDGKFLCEECATDNHKCFVCKNSEPKTVLCSVSDCGRYYHEKCVGTFQSEGTVMTFDRPFSCPLHSCFTCQLKRLDKGSVSDDDNDLTDLLVCVRCPMAYHMTDSCVSAGSLGLSGRYIVCSRHFEPSKTHSSLHTKASSSWCFICEKGGSLIYCDCCPAAYHTACLKLSIAPSGAWQCPDCSRGKTPLYGDLVWVKFGSYRWWPAEIYHPASLPSNIQDLPHQVGEFPVCFFGSHDYLWLHRGRVFPFKEGDKCCREAEAKGTAKIFDKAMKEAIAVYRMINPNIKPPTNSTIDRNSEKFGAVRKKTNHDGNSSNKDDEDVGDDVDDDNDDGKPKAANRLPQKTLPSGERKTKQSKVKPNSKVLRQLQRQSRALSLMESPRLSVDGQAPKMVNDHETNCYRCGQDGSLILCDKPKCPKAFHLKCTNKSKLPHGMWLCPWHHCDLCGKAAIQFCSRCPNSYCPDHVLNNIVFSYELGMICAKHPDIELNTEYIDTTLSLAYLDSSRGSAERSKSNEFVETGKKKQRRKSVKKRPLPVATGRRSAVVPHRLTDLDGETDNSRSDSGRLTIVGDVAPAANKNNDSSRKSRRAKSKLQKSKTFKKTNESNFTSSASHLSLSTGEPDDSELDDSSFVSPARKKPASRLDSPMFDNSDDEFPQLVIDVPTL